MAALDDTIKKLEQLINLLNKGSIDASKFTEILGTLKTQRGLDEASKSAYNLVSALTKIETVLKTLSTIGAPSWLPGLLKIQSGRLTRPFPTMKQEAIDLTGPIPDDLAFEEAIARGTGSKGKGVSDVLNKQLKVSIENIAKLKDAAQGLGVTWKNAAISVKPYTDELQKVVIYSQEGENVTRKLTRFIDISGNVYDEAAIKMERLAAATKVYSREQLIQGLGGGRAEKALALAQQKGFGIETLRNVYTQQPSGISYLKFIKEVDGVTQKLELTMNRFGEVIVRTNKRLLGFFDSIIRNTGEVLRWSFGVGIVYGTMRKLQDLLAVAIDNQTKLADVTVVLGDAQRDVNEIFDDANAIAQETGETVNGVIESYTMAYRAVGAIEEPIRRTAAASKLLYDATVLNKLSGLSAAEAIDVLSGSLRQLQKPEEDVAEAFGRGADLLDKWVRVTTKANVDLATLATAFSITSESAENSGASIEELNAVIAVLSEKIGGLGGRETGNAVRALIGGVYQQQAAETLAQYGIAVTDTTGKMRDFLDISREIYDLYSAGLISEDELNKIGYVLGGGVRRGQQYIAFLSDLGRVQEIVAAQANSQGAAQDALGRKLETVATESTKLANAFQSLAQTLGTKGGVLDVTTGLLKTLTSLVGIIDTLSDKLGSFTIPVALSGLLLLLQSTKSGQFADINQRVGGWFGGMVSNVQRGLVPNFSGYPATTQMTEYGSRFGTFMGRNWMGFAAGALPGIAKAGEVGGTKGLAEGGAIIAGGILGTLATGGSPIGGIIGAAIASSFVSAIEDSEGTLDDLFRRVIGETAKEPTGGPADTKRTPEQIIEDMFFAPGTGGKYGFQISAAMKNISKGIGAIFEGREITPEDKATAYTEALEYLNTVIDIYNQKRDAGIQLTEKEIDEYERAKLALDQFNEALENRPTEFIPGQEPTRLRQKGLFQDYFTQLNDIETAARTRLQQQLTTGAITGREYFTKVTTLGGLGTELSKIFPAIYGEVDQATMSTDELVQKFQDLADLITRASPEEITLINQLVEEITNLRDLLKSLEGKGEDAVVPWGDAMLHNAEIADLLTQKVQLLTDTLSGMGTTQLLRDFKAPQVVELDESLLGSIDRIMQEAYDLQVEYLQKGTIDGSTLTQNQIDTIINSYKPVWIKIGDQWKQVFQIDPQYIQESIDKLEKAGEIGLGFQAYDMTFGQFNQAIAGYQSLLATLTGMGYQADEQDQIGIFQDGIQPLRYDFKIVQYLLSQILDTEKKQLEGMWNLPEGANFWIPLATAQLYARSGGGGPTLPTGGGEKEEKPPTISDLAAVERARMLVLGEGLQAQGRGSTEADFLAVMTAIKNALIPLTGQQTTQGLDRASMFQFGYHLRPTEAAPPEDTTKLGKENIINFKLEINSRTQLVVDGRTLADIIKPYLTSDMLSAEGLTTITRNVVI